MNANGHYEDSFKIEIANYVIEIDSGFRFSKELFHDFLTNKDADFHVVLDMSDLNTTQAIMQNNQLVGLKGTIENSSIHRKITEALIDYDCIMIHGAAIALDNRGYLFSAASGTGKSTHIKKWLQKCNEVAVVSDDKPYVRLDDEPLICGAPWAGKERMTSNTVVPLKSIVFLERASNNSITKISFAEAFVALYKQVYRPKNAAKMKRVLDSIKKLDGKVDFYRFKINNYKEDCFDIAYNALINQS